MINSGLLVQRILGAEAVCQFVLDPIAECLAAYEHAISCGERADRWRRLIADVLERGESADGFLMALRMNHAAYRQELGFPDIEFPGQPRSQSANTVHAPERPTQ
jgi:hypothetical protein